MATILAVDLISIEAPITLVWVDVEFLGVSKTWFGYVVGCSIYWAFSLLWLLRWHVREIWVPKPNTNQHNELVIWVIIRLQHFLNLVSFLVVKTIVAS